jgi:membrane protein required for beta-lactamase induction
MTFIITLVVLMLERFFHWHHLRHWRWFARYERWLSLRMNALPAALILTAILLPPLLGIGMLQYLLADRWWGSLKFIFSIIVVLYCLGPENLWVQAYRCIHALTKQEPAAISQAQSAFGFSETNHPQAFHQAFVRALFLASHQRIFAVLFWFVLLGPVGAVLYRLIESVSTQAMTGTKLAGHIKNLLDWLPVRFEVVLFALSGHFIAVLACWKRGVFKGLNANDQFLSECGVAALDVLEHDQLPETGAAEQEALALIDRAWTVGLVILAIVVLLR